MMERGPPRLLSSLLSHDPVVEPLWDSLSDVPGVQRHDPRSARAAVPSPRKAGRHPLHPTNPHPRPAPGGGPRPQESGAPGGGWGAWRPPAAFMSLCRRHLSGEACDTLMFLGKGVWPRGSGTSGLMGPLFGTAGLKEGLSRHAGGGHGVPGSE